MCPVAIWINFPSFLLKQILFSLLSGYLFRGTVEKFCVFRGENLFCLPLCCRSPYFTTWDPYLYDLKSSTKKCVLQFFSSFSKTSQTSFMFRIPSHYTDEKRDGKLVRLWRDHKIENSRNILVSSRQGANGKAWESRHRLAAHSMLFKSRFGIFNFVKKREQVGAIEGYFVSMMTEEQKKDEK